MPSGPRRDDAIEAWEWQAPQSVLQPCKSATTWKICSHPTPRDSAELRAVGRILDVERRIRAAALRIGKRPSLARLSRRSRPRRHATTHVPR